MTFAGNTSSFNGNGSYRTRSNNRTGGDRVDIKVLVFVISVIMTIPKDKYWKNNHSVSKHEDWVSRNITSDHNSIEENVTTKNAIFSTLAESRSQLEHGQTNGILHGKIDIVPAAKLQSQHGNRKP
jgi:hypothetical protein